MSQVSEYQSYRSAIDRQREAHDADKKRTRESHEKEVQEVRSESDQEIRDANEEYNDRLRQVRKEADEEVRRLKAEIYDRKGQRVQDEAQRLQDEKQRLLNYRAEVERDANQKIERIEKSSELRSQTSHESEKEKNASALEHQKNIVKDEVRKIRKEADREIEQTWKERAKTVEDRVMNQAKVNVEGAAELRRVSNSYEDVIDKKDRDLSAHKQAVIEKNEIENKRWADRMNSATKKVKDSFEGRETELRKEIGRVEKTYQDQIQNLKQRSNQVIQYSGEIERERAAHALQKKDEVYRKDIDQRTQLNQMEKDLLTQQIQELKVTDDPRKVSPHVLRQLEGRLNREKFQSEEFLRMQNKKQIDAVRSAYQDENRDLQEAQARKVADLARDKQQGLDIEKRQVFGLLEMNEARHSDVIDQMKNEFSSSLDRNRLESQQGLIQTQEKNNALNQALLDQKVSEKRNLQDQHSRSTRLKDREWQIKMNEQRRDFEKKIVDLELQSEAVQSELRLEAQKSIHDLERRSKQAFQEMVNHYEYQLKSQEMTAKERERFLSEHYETEIDRLKKTNQRLVRSPKA